MAGTNKIKYPSFDFLLTGARFVLGSLTEKQTKDQQGRDKANPTLFAAFAVDKRTPGVGQHLDNIIGYARHTYGFVPNGHQVGPRLQQPNFMSKSGFAWKLKDGDTDPAWSAREGCRGCWIFLCGTSLDNIRCYDSNNVQLDPKAIGLGDYCDVFIGVNVNGETGETAGLYLNPNGVRLQWKGQPIVPAGQSPDQMFGAAGQGAQPIGYQPPVAQPMPGQQGGYGAPQGQQQHYAPPAGYGTPQPQPQGQPGYMPPPSPTPAPQGGYATAAPQGYPPSGAPMQPPATAPSYGAPGAGYSAPQGNAGGYPAPQPQPGSYQTQGHAGGPGVPAGAAPVHQPNASYIAQPGQPTAYPSNPGFVAGPQYR